MKQPYIRPFGKPIRDPLWKCIAKRAAAIVAVLALSIVGAMVLIEIMANCGETYIDSKGVRHEYECVFINR